MGLGILAFQWGFYSPLLVSYLHDHWTNDHRSATAWFSDLSSLVWRHLQDLWILRNTTLHSPSNAVKEAESLIINTDITNLLQELATKPLCIHPCSRWTIPSEYITPIPISHCSPYMAMTRSKDL